MNAKTAFSLATPGADKVSEGEEGRKRTRQAKSKKYLELWQSENYLKKGGHQKEKITEFHSRWVSKDSKSWKKKSRRN